MLDKLRRWHGEGGQDFQVCTIDDGSTDATAHLLERFASEHSGWLELTPLLGLLPLLLLGIMPSKSSSVFH